MPLRKDLVRPASKDSSLWMSLVISKQPTGLINEVSDYELRNEMMSDRTGHMRMIT